GDGTGICGPDGLAETGDEDCNDANGNQFPGNSDEFQDGVDGDCDGLDCQTLDVSTTRFALCTEDPAGHSWAEAEDLCLAAGYDGLASIQTSNENQQVSDQMISLRANSDPTDPPVWDGVWLGLNQLLVGAGDWSTWPDGTPLDEHLEGDPIPWLPDQPNDHGTMQDCLLMQEPQGWPDPGWPYINWNDVICSSVHGFVCMRR
ncbi:MAG TPA: hypothetical protein DIU15_15945, partial [Deltaproteobacteria bacterium]|nr:hypothetical protein [Deltaproteobacteria bacterium]